MRTRFSKEINHAANAAGLDPILVEALVVQESSGNADAFRFEPDFWNRYLKNNPKYRGLNPRRVSSSYGLMQVMFCRIWEDKIASNDGYAPEMLFVPEINLGVGCGLLKELLDWAHTRTVPAEISDPRIYERIALAAYNGGRGGNDPAKNWPLRNGKYADQVLAKYDVLKKEYES